MPHKLQWQQHYCVGNASVDAQHRSILALCNTLADCVDDGSPAGDSDFHRVFNRLMEHARAHFSAEEMLLTRCGYPSLDAYRNERDEFEYLASDIMTTENFDRSELQRFLTLWWLGHFVDCGKQYGAYLEKTVVE